LLGEVDHVALELEHLLQAAAGELEVARAGGQARHEAGRGALEAAPELAGRALRVGEVADEPEDPGGEVAGCCLLGHVDVPYVEGLSRARSSRLRILPAGESGRASRK